MLKNLSIKKLLMGISLLVVSVLLVQLILLKVLSLTHQNRQNEAERSTQSVLASKDLIIHLVQIQQFLSDVSATGEKTGFDEAKKHYELSLKTLTQLESLVSPSDRAMITELKPLIIQIYQVGGKMAEAYRVQGREAGNVLMKDFDMRVETLSNQLEKVIQNVNQAHAAQQIAVDNNTQYSIYVILLTTLIVALIVIISLKILYKNTVPILDKIVPVIKNMQTGDLSGVLVHAAEAQKQSSQNEMVSMIYALHVLLENFKQVIREVVHSTKVLVKDTKNINHIGTEVLASAQTQNAEVVTIAAAIEQMSNSIAVVAESALEAQTSSVIVQKLAKEGELIVSDVNIAIRQIETVVQNTINLIHSMNEKSNQINVIVTVIQEITEQTNLVALNAAIESARAGEAGRGFSIVADEVRKLAEKTTKATESITETILSIQAETGLMIDEVGVVEQRVQFSANLAEQAHLSLEKIKTQATNTVTQMRDITQSTTEQMTASRQIASNIEMISQAIEQISMTIRHSSDIAKVLAELVNRLNTATKHFKI